ncbi:MAG TPA: HAD family hydrolase [Candidatus Competibacteraceae bacterium]|nr:HAD family hydrolase [Candidatus Competibacteraceae bacterium]
MALAIFDLDDTLLAGDSNALWSEFLAERGVLDGAANARARARYDQAYASGTLDIHDYTAFMLEPVLDWPAERLLDWQQRFVEERVLPALYPAALELLERHRMAGDTLLIMTATNRVITGPIARILAVEHLLATEPERRGGRYTGRIAGIPCFRQGKVQRLQLWLEASGASLAGSHFYSDSHNDLPLLELVEHPVAVNPDPRLAAHARHRDWPVLRLEAPAAVQRRSG